MISSSLQNPSSKSVVIYVDAKTGLGDLSSAVAIADIFHKAGLSAHKIYLSTEESLFEKLRVFSEEKPYHVIPLKEGLKVLNVSFSVFYPSDGSSALPYQSPCIHITECARGFKKEFTGIGLQFGLDPELGECGVLLDEELIEMSYVTPFCKKTLFASLDPFLQEHLLAGTSIEDLLPTLFTGYSHFGISSLAYVLSLARLIEHDITVFLPFGPTKIAPWIHGEHKDLIFSELEKAGIAELDVILLDQKTHRVDPLFHKSVSRSEGKKLKLFVGPLAHKDFKLLQLVSNKETLCTGDRSHHEALSCNKSYVYEAMSHKIDYSRQIKALYKTHPPHVIDTCDERVSLLEHVDLMTRYFQSVRSDNYAALTLEHQEIVRTKSAKQTLEESAHMLNLLSTPPLSMCEPKRPLSAPSRLCASLESTF